MTGRTRRRRDPLTYEPKSLDEVWTHFEEPEFPEDQYTYDWQMAHLRHVALTLAHPPNRQARIARAVIIGFLIFVFALAISGLFVGWARVKRPRSITTSAFWLVVWKA